MHKFPWASTSRGQKNEILTREEAKSLLQKVKHQKLLEDFNMWFPDAWKILMKNNDVYFGSFKYEETQMAVKLTMMEEFGGFVPQIKKGKNIPSFRFDRIYKINE